MDTPAPHSKLSAANAVDLAMKGACRRVMSTDRLASDRRRRGPLPVPLRIPSTLSQKESLITVSARHLPVTESARSRHNEAVSMPDIQKFDLREWLVPPILLPLLFGLVVAGAVIVQW
jgi:hypothetical protein